MQNITLPNLLLFKKKSLYIEDYLNERVVIFMGYQSYECTHVQN